MLSNIGLRSVGDDLIPQPGTAVVASGSLESTSILVGCLGLINYFAYMMLVTTMPGVTFLAPNFSHRKSPPF